MQDVLIVMNRMNMKMFSINKNSNKYIGICILMIILPISLYAQEIITLKAAIDSTLKNNLQIKQADFSRVLADQEVFQSKMNILPSLSAGLGGRITSGNFFDERTGTVGNTTNKSLDGNVGARVTIFQGFQNLNQIKSNKYLLESYKSNVDRVRNDLKLSVLNVYIEALTNNDLWKASEGQLKLSKEQLVNEEIGVEVGNKTLADLSQARSQVALDELNVINAKNAYEGSILTLKQLMEMNIRNKIVLKVPVYPEEFKKASEYSAINIVEKAMTIFPEVRQAEFNSLAAEQSVKITKGAYYPSLSLSSGLGTAYTTYYRDLSANIFPLHQQIRDNFSQYIGFSLNIPVFNNLNTRIGVRKSKVRYENAKTEEQQIKNNLNKVINQALLDLRSAEQRYRSSEQAFIAMKETFNVVKQRYEVGLSNAIELSTSQTNMNKTEFDFIISKYNLIFRSRVIDYYLGKPIQLD